MSIRNVAVAVWCGATLAVAGCSGASGQAATAGSTGSRTATGATTSGATGSASTGTAGASGSTTSGASSTSGSGAPGAFAWAQWPMPNPASAGLPNPSSYDTRTPGVVVDNVTHLMWQQPLNGQIVNWAGAPGACSTLSLGGYSDWRLPTEIELFSLVDFTKAAGSASTVDAAAFPQMPGTTLWSATPLAGPPGNAWVVDFYSGNATYYPVMPTSAIRCVRGGSGSTGSGQAGAPPGQYTVAGGTVQDNKTGLTWQQVASAAGITWDQAQAHCASLTLNGSGWRVPSVKELMTLVDFGVVPGSGPTVDTTAFPNAPVDFYWSSTPVAGSPGSAWFVNFYYGSADTHAVSDAHVVRCVR